MRCFLSLFVPVLVLAGCIAALAQMPTYNLGNLGRTPSEGEIKAWDIAIHPEGKELPAGKGTAKAGAIIYAQRCAYCHGPTGTEGGPANLWPYSQPRGYGIPPLVGGKFKPLRGIWRSPVATTIWDYINRAKPVGQEDTLSADEVYALTALVFYWNGLIQESDVLDAKSLPKIQMPGRKR